MYATQLDESVAIAVSYNMSIRPCTSEPQKKAEEELNEIPSRINEDLNYIKEWLKTQPQLNVEMDYQWRLSFLRGCKFNLQRTKEKIYYLYTTRTTMPELFSNRDPFSPEMQKALEASIFFPLPETKDKVGPRIFMILWKNCDPNKITAINLIKIYLMSVEILMHEDDNSVVSGIYLWIDCGDFNLHYIPQFTLGCLRKTICCMESAYPLRVKGVFSTNVPFAVEIVINLAKLLMSKKLRERMHVFSAKNFDKAYKSIPKTIMPKEFGGNGESIDELAARWKEKLESYRDWFTGDVIKQV